ncbi:MAG: hypothetical protein GY780_03830 [bacterium]|nr:hypothetical protein [bacterium]
MILLPDGSVGLVLESLGIVSFVDPNGDPGGSFRFESTDGGNYAMVSGGGQKGSVVLSGRCSRPGKTRNVRNRRNFLLRSNLQGEETAVYVENHWVFDFNSFEYTELDELPSFQYAFDVAADGSLWILSGRGMKSQKAGTMALLDVFDNKGVFVRQVELVAPHDAARAGIVIAEGNRVIVIEGFLESIACQFGNSATFSGENWNTPEVIVYEMNFP